MQWLLGGMLTGTVVSQMLLDACLVLTALFYIYTRARQHPYRSYPPFFQVIGIEWALVGYLLTAVLSLAINAPSPTPWFYSLRKFTWIIDLYLITWGFSQISASLKKWLVFFSIAFLLPNLYAISGVLLSFDPITGATEVKRAIGLVNSATYHAHGNGAIFIFFLTVLSCLLPHLSSREKCSYALSFGLMILSIFLTYTRGIWISVSLATMLLLVILNWRLAALGVLCYAGAVSALFFASTTFHHRVTAFFAGNEGDDIRKQLYEVFWLMFKDHPILGIGYWDQYRQIESYWPRLGLPADHFTSHAHNQFLNTLATTGLVGFFFYLSIIGYFLLINFRLYRSTNDTARKILFLACLVTQVEFHLACFTDVTFEYAKLRAIILLVWALLISLKRDRIKVSI